MMAPKASKIAIPAASPDVAPAAQVKANQRIDNLLRDFGQDLEPKRVRSSEIVVDVNNRKGQPCDLQYIHTKLVPGILKDGIILSRLKPGLLIHLTDPVKRTRAIAHNKALMEGTEGLYPPIHENAVLYSCIGGNHLTISIAGIACQMVSAVTGSTWACPLDDHNLKKLATDGHHYIVLKDTISDEDAAWLAETQNADQNQNAGTNQATNLREVTNIHNAFTIEKQTPHIKTSDIITRFTKQNVVTVNPNVIAAYHKFVTALGAGEYVIELLDWLSKHVNFTELSVAPSWLEECGKSMKDMPLGMFITTQLQYSGEVVVRNQRPTPDSAKFILTSEIASLMKNSDVCAAWEAFLRDMRVRVEPELKSMIGPVRAREIISQLEIWSGRMAYQKSQVAAEFAPKIGGKFSKEKLDEGLLYWAISVADKFSALKHFPGKIGVVLESDKVETDVIDEVPAAYTPES